MTSPLLVHLKERHWKYLLEQKVFQRASMAAVIRNLIDEAIVAQDQREFDKQLGDHLDYVIEKETM